MLKKISLVILTTIFILYVIYFELINYALKMGYNQIKIIQNAVPIEVMLLKDSLNDTLRHKLNIIIEAKKFALDSLGLVESKNYESVYDQKGKPVLWNVSACEPYAFKPKTWSFPIIGSFPYKGFFDIEDAKTEYKRLRDQNYDVRVRPVNGWSTLGWFNDPLLSENLKRSEGDLVNLIFHEMTHSTLFVKDSVEFNENLATFVGDYGSEYFLASKYGVNSNELRNYINSDSLFVSWRKLLINLYDHLDSVYNDNTFKLKKNHEKDSIKTLIINLNINKFVITQNMDSNQVKIYKDIRLNNAYIMSIKRYNSKSEELNKLFKNDYKSNFKRFINELKKNYSHE